MGEILEKKKLREDRRKKMGQQKMAKHFAFNGLLATYHDEAGNRRSSRMKDRKKVSYKDVGSDGEEEESQNVEHDESEEHQEKNNVDVDSGDQSEDDEEPKFYLSGRQKRQ